MPWWNRCSADTDGNISLLTSNAKSCSSKLEVGLGTPGFSSHAKGTVAREWLARWVSSMIKRRSNSRYSSESLDGLMGALSLGVDGAVGYAEEVKLKLKSVGFAGCMTSMARSSGCGEIGN
ncbi:hypothetical protein L1987_47219 [Smallanthus sonchifolius]|uniref:Uncharacterized protein n=1 Tax=Smallanthus sonchifolius TaxID=185202 RepID=A0ACB9G1L3_9ASTR|nr:hypothetical protein L1987_47219 [Smallanthus sonchifolius]